MKKIFTLSIVLLLFQFATGMSVLAQKRKRIPPKRTSIPKQTETPDSEKQLTNSHIIRMVKAGFGETIILNAIGTGESKFDVSMDALFALKNAGVNQKIIEAMQVSAAGQKQTPPQSVQAQSPITSNSNNNQRLLESKNSSNEEESFKNLQQPYVLAFDQNKRLAMSVNVPTLVQTKAKGDSIATIVADDAVRTIAGAAIINVASNAAANVALATGSGLAAMPIIGGAAAVLMNLPMLRRGPTFTFLYALEGRESKTKINTQTPKFELFYGDVVGANPDDFEPVLVRITSTPNNWRLVAAHKAKARIYQSSDKNDFNIIEEIVPSQINKIGRGHSTIVPQQPLGAGEYGVVFRPVSKTYKTSYQDMTYRKGEGILLGTVWDFTVPGNSAESQNNNPAVKQKLETVPQNLNLSDSKDSNQSQSNSLSKTEVPEIVINADIDKVRSVILRQLVQNKFNLVKDEPSQLVFSKGIGGAGGFLGGVLLSNNGKNPRHVKTFIISKTQNGVLVLVKLGVMHPDRNGQGDITNIGDKKTKQNLAKELLGIKAEAEK